MKRNQFPPGWNEERVRSVLADVEKDIQNGTLHEAEERTRPGSTMMMEIPRELVDEVNFMIARHERAAEVAAKPRKRVSTATKKEAAAPAHGTNNRR